MQLRIAPARPDIRVLAALVALLFLSAVLGMINLDYDALWQDELLSVMDAGGAPYPSRSLVDVWNGIASRNPYHAPGFFLMLNLWGRLVGWEPLALRMLPFLAGLLAVAWMYRLGAAVLSKRAGLAAAGLLVASVFFQHYTHELRMYSLMVLLGTFNLWAYYRLLARGFGARRRLWLGYWLSIVGMLYLHYFAALPLIAVGVYHLFFRRRDAGWWRALAVMLAGALAFVPWLGALLDGLRRAQGDTAIRALALAPTDALQRTLLALSNGSTLAALVLVGLLGIVAVLAWRHPDARLRAGLRRLGFVASLTLALLLTGNALTEMLHEGRLRYVLVLWAPVLPLLAAAFTAGRGRLRQVLAVGLLLWLTFGVSLTLRRILPFNVDDRAYIFPLQLVAREYRQNAQPEDFLLAFVPPNQFTWRYRFLGDYYLAGIGGGYSIPNVYDEGGGDEDDPAALYAAIQARERLWVASMPAAEPSQLSAFEALLPPTFAPCQQRMLDGRIHMTLYTRSVVCCGAAAPPAPLIQFENGAQLAQQAPVASTVAAAPLVVQTGWHLAAVRQPADYSVGYYLMDAAGTLLAQTDVPLADEDYVCRTATLDLTAVPPGDYSLKLSLYPWQTVVPVPGTTPAAGQPQTLHTLGTVTVR